MVEAVADFDGAGGGEEVGDCEVAEDDCSRVSNRFDAGGCWAEAQCL